MNGRYFAFTVRKVLRDSSASKGNGSRDPSPESFALGPDGEMVKGVCKTHSTEFTISDIEIALMFEVTHLSEFAVSDIEVALVFEVVTLD
jgi:hypothetical protein